MVGSILGEFLINFTSLSSFSPISSVGDESARKFNDLIARLFCGASCKLPNEITEIRKSETERLVWPGAQACGNLEQNFIYKRD